MVQKKEKGTVYTKFQATMDFTAASVQSAEILSTIY